MQTSQETLPHSDPNHGPNYVSMGVLGDKDSGKSALVQRYIDDRNGNTHQCTLKKRVGNSIDTITLSINYQCHDQPDKMQIDDHQVYLLCFSMYSEESFKRAINVYNYLSATKQLPGKWTVMFVTTDHRGTVYFVNSQKRAKELWKDKGLSATNDEADENVNVLFETAVANQLGCAPSAVKTCAKDEQSGGNAQGDEHVVAAVECEEMDEDDALLSKKSTFIIEYDDDDAPLDGVTRGNVPPKDDVLVRKTSSFIIGGDDDDEALDGKTQGYVPRRASSFIIGGDDASWDGKNQGNAQLEDGKDEVVVNEDELESEGIDEPVSSQSNALAVGVEELPVYA